MKGEQFFLGLFNRTLRSAFMQWVAFWEEMNRQRQLVRKSLMRISQRVLAECFEDWLALLERKRAAEESHRRFERAVRYMKNRAVHMAFERWSEYVSGAQMQRKKLRKVVLRLLNIKVAASLQGWADMASTRRLQRARVRKSVSRILHRVSSMAFVTWFDQVEELKHQRTIISRALGKITMRRRAMAFSSWAEAVEEKRTFHHGVVQTSKFLLALMKRRHRAIFSGWLWQVEELKRLRFLVKKSLGRMLQRQMASAFDTWISAVRHTHTEIASNAKIKGAVAHMMNRALGISFYRWLDSVRTLRSRRGLLSKVIIRMQKKTLAAAFSYWRSFAYEHRVMANKVRKVIGRWQGTTIFTTMRKWRHYVQLLSSRRALIRKVIMRWEHQVQTKALHSWSNAVVLERSRRTLVGKLLARTASRSLQMVFISWREVARQRVDMHEGHLLYAVPRILAVKKRFAFKIWTRYIRKVRGHRNRAKKMGQELTAHAFTTWRLHASLKVRVLEDTKYQQERETHKQLLDTAYDKVLRECEALEGKVMTLESQRDADFANFEFGNPGFVGGSTARAQRTLWTSCSSCGMKSGCCSQRCPASWTWRREARCTSMLKIVVPYNHVCEVVSRAARFNNSDSFCTDARSLSCNCSDILCVQGPRSARIRTSPTLEPSGRSLLREDTGCTRRTQLVTKASCHSSASSSRGGDRSTAKPRPGAKARTSSRIKPGRTSALAVRRIAPEPPSDAVMTKKLVTHPSKTSPPGAIRTSHSPGAFSFSRGALSRAQADHLALGSRLPGQPSTTAAAAGAAGADEQGPTATSQTSPVSGHRCMPATGPG